jgi:Ser/Thr protein kinase RdoA (MazF antagonist)
VTFKPLWIHDPESLQNVLKDIYTIPRLTVLQTHEVSALRERSHGTVKMRLSGADESMACLHWSKPQVKTLLREELRDFCLPLQMWVRTQGSEAPAIWCANSGAYLWTRNGLSCFVESFNDGTPMDAWCVGHLEAIGSWIGRLHRSLRAYTPWCLRSLHLNLDRIHERWTLEARELLKDPFKPIDDPREEIRLQMLGCKELLEQVVDEFRRTQAESGALVHQCIHGDLNSSNIFWTSGGKNISGVIDWKASRFDARIVDLLRPVRDHVLPEGKACGSEQLPRLRALVTNYCAESGPLSLDEANLIVPALIMMDISFLTWQLKQPVYPQRAMNRLKDIRGLWALRHEIADHIMEAGHTCRGSRRPEAVSGMALPRRIELFPYYQSRYQEHYRKTLFDADAVVFHLPALCKSLARDLVTAGVKPLAYISLAKTPHVESKAHS